MFFAKVFYERSEYMVDGTKVFEDLMAGHPCRERDRG